MEGWVEGPGRPKPHSDHVHQTLGSFAQRYVELHGPADGFLPCDRSHLIRRARGVPGAWKGYKQPLSAVAGPNSSYHARHQSLTDQVGRLPRGYDPQTDPSNGGSGIVRGAKPRARRCSIFGRSATEWL